MEMHNLMFWLFGIFGSILLILLKQQVSNNHKTAQALIEIQKTQSKFSVIIERLEEDIKILKNN